MFVREIWETDKMASKLRRTPLFGCDGNLGIPIIPKQGNSNGSASKSQKSSSSYDYKVGWYKYYYTYSDQNYEKLVFIFIIGWTRSWFFFTTLEIDLTN